MDPGEQLFKAARDVDPGRRLWNAAQDGDLETARRLVEGGANVNWEHPDAVRATLTRLDGGVGGGCCEAGVNGC